MRIPHLKHVSSPREHVSLPHIDRFDNFCRKLILYSLRWLPFRQRAIFKHGNISTYLPKTGNLRQSCPWVPFMWPDSTQPISWLTRTNPLQVEKNWTQPDPTQYKLMSLSGLKPVPGLKWVQATQLNRKLRTQVSNTSKSASLWSYCHFITPSDRFPVPVRSAEKSNLTAWCNQILSNCAWNALT